VPSFPIDNRRTSHGFLLVPSSQLSGDSLVAEDEDLPSSDFLGPVLGWIGQGCGDTSWHDFVPPSCLHELDFMISYDMMHALTHVIFVLNLSLFWFMMKHRGRYYDILLGWFHWLYDYT
jgi:hypothetical protein